MDMNLNQPPIIHAIARHASVPVRLSMASTCKSYRNLVFTDPHMWKNLVVLEPWQKRPGFVVFLEKIADFVEKLWLPRMDAEIAESLPLMPNVKDLEIFQFINGLDDSDQIFLRMAGQCPGVERFSLERKTDAMGMGFQVTTIFEGFPRLKVLFAWFDSNVLCRELDDFFWDGYMVSRKLELIKGLDTFFMASGVSDFGIKPIMHIYASPLARLNVTHLAIYHGFRRDETHLLTCLAEMTNLESLVIFCGIDNEFGDVLVAIAPALRKLKTLALVDCSLSSDDLYNFIENTAAELETLVVQFWELKNISSNHLGALGLKMRSLQNLILHNADFNDKDGLASHHFAHFNSLEYFSLSGSGVLPLANMLALATRNEGLKRLRYLFFDNVFSTRSEKLMVLNNLVMALKPQGCHVFADLHYSGYAGSHPQWSAGENADDPKVAASTLQALRLHPASKFNRSTVDLLQYPGDAEIYTQVMSALRANQQRRQRAM